MPRETTLAHRSALRRTPRGPFPGWWLVVLALVAWPLVACRAPTPTPLRPTRGYLLISIDTLRADHLGTYGYERPTSPFLDSLAARGVLFENAYVQLPGTLPSHMSIFTGLYPAEHGVMPPAGVLSGEVATLPEVFKRHGFRTAGHSEGGYVHGGYGFARGFDEWSHEAKEIESDAERTFARGLDFLRRLGADERFFLFLHTYSVHDPYFRLDELSSYPREKYAGLYWQGPIPETFPPTGPELSAFNRGERELSAAGLELFKARYDAAITYVDDVLRDFFAELEALGLSDEVTVVLTSDHGEEFLEHGRLTHIQIHPECLRVPLIVLHPEIPGARRVAGVVESIDIAPTLYQIAGIEPPEMSGESLVPWLLGRSPAESSEAFAVADRAQSTLVRADAQGLHQLIISQPTNEGMEGCWMGRELSFDVLSGSLELEAFSYHEPRELRVTIDGRSAGTHHLLPTEVTRISAELDGVSRITLEADGCVSPASLGLSEDRRCLAVHLRGRPCIDFQLFDLEADPMAQQNRSREAEPQVRSLLQHLRRYERLEPVSTTSVKELDPELEERLRALGYLR